MGNAKSSPTLVHDEVKVKSSLAGSGAPLPRHIMTAEQLLDLPEVKSLLLRNLDSDHFISCLLEETDTPTLLKSLKSFRTYSAEETAQLRAHLDSLNDCVKASIKVKSPEVLSILESNLALKAEVGPLPFLLAMQKRLAAFAMVPKLVDIEKATYTTSEQHRQWSKATMNSIANPELTVFTQLQSFGIEFLRVFSQHLSGVLLEKEETRRPVVQLCNSLGRLSDLSLFRSWSPKNKPPLVVIPVASVESSEAGNSLAITQSPSEEGWSCSGGWWSAHLLPQRITWIKVLWQPLQGLRKSQVGAPRRLLILIRTKGSDSFQRHAMVDPDQVKREQGSWHQFYRIDRDDVVEIRLSFSCRQCQSNTLNASTMYQFQVLFFDSTVDWVDPRALFCDTQQALLPLLAMPRLHDSAVAAVFALLRAAGSATLVIQVANHLLEDEAPASAALVLQVEKLLLCVAGVRGDLCNAYNTKFSAVKVDDFQAVFDCGRKFGDCTVASEGSLVDFPAGGCGCCFLSCDMQDGVYEWSFTLSTDCKTVKIGLASEIVNVCDNVSSKVWSLQCSTGAIHPLSSCKPVDMLAGTGPALYSLSYSSTSGTVKLSHNGAPKGVIFEGITGIARPFICVVNCESDMRIELSSISRTKCSTANPLQPLSLDKRVPLPPQPSTKDCVEAVLIEMGRLADMNLLNLLANASADDSFRAELETPFSVEVSVDTLRALVALVQRLRQCNMPSQVVSAALSMIELQFYALQLSRLPMSFVERCVELDCGSREADFDSTFQQVSECLMGCCSSTDAVVREAALRAFSRGFTTFLPHPHARIEAAIKTLAEAVEGDPSRAGVVTTLLQQLTQSGELESIVKCLTSVAMEALVYQLIEKVVNVLHQYEIRPIGASCFAEHPVCVAAKSTLERLLVHLSTEIVSNPTDGVERCYLKCVEALCEHGKRLLAVGVEVCNASAVESARADRAIRSTTLGQLILPMVCSMTWRSLPLSVLSRLTHTLTDLLDALCIACSRSLACREALWLISRNSMQQRVLHKSVSKGCWRTIKAAFEEFDSSFSLSDNGSTYVSVHSGNTCAIVPIKFSSGQRGAWEFLLESDANGDECSVFGAARLPLSSRCYSSSPDLWMRRAYNGYMYSQGQATGSNMDKIHPGDIVRIEFDGNAGTLSFSVNGSEPEVGFRDIVDDVYPACGSYRNGVSIKLLKVEVFEKVVQMENADEKVDVTTIMSPNWQYASPASITRDPLVLSHPKDKKGDASQHWLTARSSCGALLGVHDWVFELGDISNDPFAVGIVVGGDALPDKVKLGSKRLSTAEVDSFDYAKKNMSVFAWHSDGSLWFNGTRQGEMGLHLLPLRNNSIVTVRVDRQACTVSFFVDGVYVATAFGPEGSESLCSIPLPAVHIDQCVSPITRQNYLVYPAGSVYGKSWIRLTSGGLLESIVPPFMLTLRQATASVISRIGTRLIEGDPVGKEEKEILQWLQSPLFVGGVDERLVHLLSAHEVWMGELCSSEYSSSGEAQEVEPSPIEALVVRLACLAPEVAMECADVKALYECLERLDPDPPFLRSTLERSGAYRFPICELPFIACLLKQSGLVDEAIRLASYHNSGGSCGSGDGDGANDDNGSHLPPSEDMFMLWQKVKQLRTHLRHKRQHFRLSECQDQSASDAGVASIDSILAACAEKMESTGFAFSLDIQWYSQINCHSCSGDTADCTILAAGIDREHELLYILCDVNSPQALGLHNNGKLRIEELEISSRASLLLPAEDDAAVHRLVQCFDLCQLPTTTGLNQLSSIDYSYRATDYSAAKLTLNPSSTAENARFHQLCIATRERALLVLTMSSNMRTLDSSSRLAMLGMMSKYSGGGGSLFRNKAELTRWRTQERWRRVVEFLRVQSRIQRHSEEVDDQSGMEVHEAAVGSASHLEHSHQPIAPADTQGRPSEAFAFPPDNRSDLSNTQAALQACAVFVTSEDIKCSARMICSTIKLRIRRARCRMLAFSALQQVLSCPAVLDEPFVVYDVLAGLENAFLPDSSSGNGGSAQDSHYLYYLQGCSGHLLSMVQAQFCGLYQCTAGLLASFVSTWEAQHSKEAEGCTLASYLAAIQQHRRQLDYPPSVYMNVIVLITRMWMVRFSTRDFGWIAKGGLLPTLYKLGSLTFHEKAVKSWAQLADDWLAKFPVASAAAASLPEGTMKSIKLWPSDSVQDGLRDGSLSGSEVLLHAIQVCWSNFGVEDRAILGDKAWSAQSLLACSVKEATKAYWLVAQKYQNREEQEEEEKRQKELEIEELAAKEMRQVADRLRPCGMFDPQNMAPQIQLGEINSVATLREDETGISVCAYCTVHINTRAENLYADCGNYFEVTIQQVGRRDIGIGFADNSTFPVVEKMPGWVQHSYGYHGDDGKKYGDHATDGDWPTFEVGDIVGCGYDHERRAIFYTRNGELLGDGFVGVNEEQLWPIVGFSNRHLETVKVKINFGLDPFAYRSQAIAVSPLVIAELERRALEASEATAGTVDVATSYDAGASMVSALSRPGEEEILTLQLVERALRSQESYLRESAHLRAVAGYVLQYLLFLCASKTEDSILPHDNYHHHHHHRHHHHDDQLQKQPFRTSPPSAPSAPFLSADQQPDDDRHYPHPSEVEVSKATRLTLMKDVSTYGTPREVTAADGWKLNYSIVATLLHEVMVGSKYLYSLSAGRRLSIVQVEEEILGCEPSALPADSYCGALHPHEVENRIVSHLTTLRALMENSKLVMDDLCTVKSLRVLFSAMICGDWSAQLALSLLHSLLPRLDPDVVEDAALPHWNKRMALFKSTLIDCGIERRDRKIPDTLVRVLILDIAQMFCCGEKFLLLGESLPTEEQAIGSGNAEMCRQVMAAKLLQRLFEAPQWCELVASCVTDSLRHACVALTSLGVRRLANAEADGSSTADDQRDQLHDEKETVAGACELISLIGCAALTAFHTPPVILPGSWVEVDGIGKAVVANTSDFSSVMRVVPQSCLGDFSCKHDTEAVDSSTVQLVEHQTEVDLSRLSQPVLEELLELSRVSLSIVTAAAKASDFIERSAPPLWLSYPLRLCSSLFSTLAAIACKQPDIVVDLLHEADLVGELIDHCKRRSFVEGIVTLSELFDKWIFVQHRLSQKRLAARSKVELSDMRGETIDRVGGDEQAGTETEAKEAAAMREVSPCVLREDSCRVPLGSSALPTLAPEPASATMAADTDIRAASASSASEAMNSDAVTSATPGEPGNCLEISGAVRATRKALLLPIAEEFNVDVDTCASLAEFYMMDLDKLRYELATVSSSKTAKVSGAVPSSELKLQLNTISDENSTKGIEYSTPAGEVKPAKRPHFFRRLLSVASVETLCTGDCVVESNGEGIDYFRYENAFIFEGPLAESNRVLVRCYDSKAGMVYCSRLAFSQLKRVEYYGLKKEDVQAESLRLDWAISVAAMRSILLRMLTSGEVDLCQRSSSRPADWLPLLKLLITSAKTTQQEAISSLLTSITVSKKLFSRGQDCGEPPSRESDANPMVSVLVKDATDTLSTICETSLMSGSDAADATDLAPYIVRSRHPYPTSFSTRGKLVIPASATATQIIFDKRCSTASPGAKLKLFASEEAYRTNVPTHVFFGKEGDHKFHSMTLSSHVVYYTFEAQQNSHFAPVTVDSVGDRVRCEGVGKNRTFSLVPSSTLRRVGLGQDDTLFNLFNDDGEVPESVTLEAVLVPDCAPLLTGVAMLEVEILEDQFATVAEGRAMIAMIWDKDFTTKTEDLKAFFDPVTMWSVDSQGTVLCGNKPVAPSMEMDTWSHGDVISIVWEYEMSGQYSACYALNGRWSAVVRGSLSPGMVKGALPVVMLGGCKYKAKINLGDGFAFKYSVPESVAASFSQPPLPFIQHVVARNEALCWGYEFEVKSFSALALSLTREFDLVTSFKIDESVAEHIRPIEGSAGVFIWRAKASDDCRSLGDIFTSSFCPPPRGIVVNITQCKPPICFSCVFASNKLSMTVWRPVAPEGYVALGDIAISGTSSSPPSVDLVACVPEWAVVKGEIKERVVVIRKVGDSKSSTNASLWSTSAGFGFFFGSPYDVPRSSAKRWADFKEDGVGACYQLAKDLEATVYAEWMKEEDVYHLPSLTWAENVLGSALRLPATRRVVITDGVFTSLVNYLRSSLAVAPKRIVSLLILLVRAASREKVDLPLDSVKSLCKAILSDALGLLSKKADIPKALMNLVDFVVEVQTVHVLQSGAKDCSTISRSMERERLRLQHRAESKEESGELLETKEDDGPAAEDVFRSKSIQEWWDRPAVSMHDIKTFRVIKHENLENVFHKETILLKLKQVLKCIHAVNCPNPEAGAQQWMSSRLDRSFPKLMTSKIWFERVSTSSLVESEHPYRSRSTVRTVSFPGADRLWVMFDQRCSLHPGDKLIFKTERFAEIVVQGPLTASQLNTGFPLFDDCVVITFKAGSEEPVNPQREWGWAVLVVASGPVYESAKATIDLRELLVGDNPVLPPVPSLASTATETPTALELARGGGATGGEVGKEIGAEDGDPPVVEEVSSELGDEEMERESIRTRSQIESGDLPSVDARSATPADMGELLTADLKPTSLIDDIEVAAIVSLGKMIKSGSIAVPYASKLNVKITYHGGVASDQLEYAVGVTAASPPKDTVPSGPAAASALAAVTTMTFLRLKDGVSVSSEVDGSRANYQLWALDVNTLARVTAPPAPATASAQSGVESHQTTESVNVPGSETEEQAGGGIESGAWECSVCTLINSAACAECSVCGSLREEEDGGTRAENTTAGWWCSNCTYINPLQATECGMCGQSTASSADPAATSPPPSSPAKSSPKVVSETANSSEASASESHDVVCIVAKGTLSNTSRFETRLEAAILSRGSILLPLQAHHRISSWTRSMDSALLEYLNNRAHRPTSGELNLSEPFAIPKSFLSFQGEALSHVNMLDITMRAQLIHAFNKALESLLPLIDLSNDDPCSLGANIRKHNRYLLSKVKMPLLEKAIASTAANGGPDIPATITLNNFKALTSRELGERDPATSQNCFVQCFRQLHAKDAALFRHVFSSDRVFQIHFTGESGIDAGGVFREGVSRIVEDLFSEHFSLLVLSPNGQQAVHAGMDKFVPNPKHTGSLALEMFEFIGKLMAMSIRVKLCLPFEFPPLIWKKLVGEEVTAADLLEVDMIAARQLEAIERCHDPRLPDSPPVTNNEEFQARFCGDGAKMMFEFIGSDQQVREVVRGGSSKEVTFENRGDFCRAARAARLAEFDVHCAAMARGMGQVIPMRVLLLFSAAQVEELVCGNPKIDLALWKANTDSSGLPATTVALFWKVMESLSPQEQSGFVRFAWGRSRLPSRKEDFTTKMKLTNAGRAALPASHTCFFSIEMPEYRTEEEMRHGLLTVIHFGVGGILNG